MAVQFTAAHWRDRAEEARALAMALSDDNARQDLLKVAGQYDRLAAFTEKRLDCRRKLIDRSSS